tara:strand:- start:6405 stop:7172 length:768 start_codon:yes stop_codon:yes gene_type:complete
MSRFSYVQCNGAKESGMKYVTVIVAATIAAATMAQAETPNNSLVVIELFTSQGCSSCPPADKILSKLAKQDDILALSLHVDYWDYLGWKDKFAIAKFGERQASYNAQIINRSRRVTPQMIFNGASEVAGGVGKSAEKIYKQVKSLHGWNEPATLDIVRNGQKVTLSLSANFQDLGDADVSLVQYTPSEIVRIERGENAGKTIDYINTVTRFDIIGKWDTSKPDKINATLPGDGEYAVIVQGKRFGPVMVARRVPN